VLVRVIQTSEDLETYMLIQHESKAAPSAVRTLVLEKRSEASVRSALDWFDVVSLYGLYICGHLVPEVVQPHRYCIEFLGDSDTSAMGCEGEHTSVDDIWSLDPSKQNAANSYAAIASRVLDAECHQVCWSGLKVHSAPPTLGTDGSVVTGGMRALYPRVLPNEIMSPSPANMKNRYPDVIVIHLGACDVTDARVDTWGKTAATFTEQYIEMLKHIRTRHREVPILCVAPDQETVSMERTREGQARTSQRLQECVAAAIALAASQHDIKDVHFKVLAAGLQDPEESQEKSDWALLGHWSSEGHLKVAVAMVRAIQEVNPLWTRQNLPFVYPHMDAEQTGVSNATCAIL